MPCALGNIGYFLIILGKWAHIMYNYQHLAFLTYQYIVEIPTLQLELALRNSHIIFHDLKIFMSPFYYFPIKGFPFSF